MKLNLVLVFAMMAVSTHINATEIYNVATRVTHQNLSADSSKLNSLGIGATYFLKEIDLDIVQPTFERSFLQKANSIDAYYTRGSADDLYSSTDKLNNLQLHGRLYLNDFSFAVTAGNGDQKSTSKINTADSYHWKSDYTEFEVGYFVLPTTLVSYVNSKYKSTYASSLEISAPEYKNSRNGLKLHTISSLSETQFLVFDLFYNQNKYEQFLSQKNDEYGANLRYYPKAKYYLQLGYATRSGEHKYVNGDIISVGAGYAITPRLTVQLTTSKFNGAESVLKTNNLVTLLTADYRF